jgi:hypothetical protein
MEPAQWIATFRALHDQAKRGPLDPNQASRYVAMKDELARSLIQAEGKTLDASAPPRRVLRVPTVHQIEVGGIHKATTSELSCAGFTALIPSMMKEGMLIGFILTLSRSQEPVRGDAIVQTAVRQPNSLIRLTCQFAKMEENQLERIEAVLFDVALTRFRI